LATVTPSLVMRGAPKDLSMTTLRPFGPERDLHGVGEDVDAAQHALAGVTKFLDFWEHHLDGKVHRVRVANAQFVKPAEFRFASGLYALH
jgi:hypothetical protein